MVHIGWMNPNTEAPRTDIAGWFYEMAAGTKSIAAIVRLSVTNS
jgi:hypothetical protein